jgi:hypothetical protein
MQYNFKKKNGIFFTENDIIADKLLSNIDIKDNFLKKKFLEPSVGEGHLIIKLFKILKKNKVNYEDLILFIKENLYINDINKHFVEKTILNINNYLKENFDHKKEVIPNFSIIDFTKKINNKLNNNSYFKKHLNSFDIILGNPPFVTLYGRRDKKINEDQRIELLNTFEQFPKNVKNGKINFLMLFIENGLDLLKDSGQLNYICDSTFFENSFKYTRKYILENFFINKININLKEFENVYSSQIILNIYKKKCHDNHRTIIIDEKLSKTLAINQNIWINEKDDYKIRFYFDLNVLEILSKITKQVPNTLYQSFPKKNLRTSSMLLTYENEFTISDLKKKNNKYYNFYNGSKSLKEKYGELFYEKLFYYDKEKQNKINDELKILLIKKGIKNKKRIGLGEKIVHTHPKIYIRQSSKDLVATLDLEPSTANNSLYLFTLRSQNKNDLITLRYLCGLLNSNLYNFYCKAYGIIRTNIAKQPQMNISDLYKVPFPLCTKLTNDISELVENIYKNKSNKIFFIKEIDKLIFSHFKINKDEIKMINRFIDNF